MKTESSIYYLIGGEPFQAFKPSELGSWKPLYPSIERLIQSFYTDFKLWETADHRGQLSSFFVPSSGGLRTPNQLGNQVFVFSGLRQAKRFKKLICSCSFSPDTESTLSYKTLPIFKAELPVSILRGDCLYDLTLLEGNSLGLKGRIIFFVIDKSDVKRGYLCSAELQQQHYRLQENTLDVYNLAAKL